MAFRTGSLALLLAILAGCHGSLPSAEPAPLSSGALTQPILVPPSVQRMAILYPKSPEYSAAYSRLEGATFQLKVQRPTLKIVDRFHLPTVLNEQRFQLEGGVSEESAIRLGRLLGVDSVLIYRIEGPGLRERLWARHHHDLPPITVTSKIIRVESAEVVYHNVVTARVGDPGHWNWSAADPTDYQRLGRDALERGIARTLQDLQRAFGEGPTDMWDGLEPERE